MTDIIINSGNNLLGQIKEMINACKKNIVATVNAEMVILYWSIGKIIKSEILKNGKAEYGESIIRELSLELTRE